MSQLAGEAAGDLAANIWTSYSTRDRTLLAIGSIASFWIFWTIAGMFSFPHYYGFDASIVNQPNAVVLIIMTAVVFVACVFITSLFTNLVHFEGGLFCAAVGLLALSVRGGSMRYVLMDSPGGGIFIKLLVELVLLFAIVAVGWIVLKMLANVGFIKPEYHGDDDPDDIPGQGLMALGVQLILMTLLMLLLAQTDKKAQVIWAVAISSATAAWSAHQLFPSRPSNWYWITPLIVGAVGYLLAWTGGNSLPGGEVGGLVPALARPLPVDYASVGVAGAIYGYWTSRRMQYERDHDPNSPAEVEDALEHPTQNA